MSSSEQHSTNSEHAKKYNFHHVSVSVPITMPTRPGEKIEGHIPFKAPIIHEEPEKTNTLTREVRCIQTISKTFLFSKSMVLKSFQFLTKLKWNKPQPPNLLHLNHSRGSRVCSLLSLIHPLISLLSHIDILHLSF